MALAPSAVSIAADEIAVFVNQRFQDLGEDVHVAIDTPQATSERTKGANARHYVNFFFYRFAGSGFHAAQGSGHPLFLRMHCLVTPFPSKSDNANAEADSDLRILGRVVQLFHSQPILPVHNAPGVETDYRLEAALMMPTMEEINHIWTTQGNDIAYRLSVAYEFSLVPVEPIRRAEAAPDVRSIIVDVDPVPPVPPKASKVSQMFYGDEYQALPKPRPGDPPPAKWLPMFMFVDGGQLTNRMSRPMAAANVTVAMAGPSGQLVQMSIAWKKADGSPAGPDQVSDIALTSHLIDSPQAQTVVALQRPPLATSAVFRCTPSVNVGLVERPYTNTLTLSFT